MTALIQTIDTPDGALTILTDAQQRVLASGWSADHAEILARVHPSLRPDRIAEFPIKNQLRIYGFAYIYYLFP